MPLLSLRSRLNVGMLVFRGKGGILSLNQDRGWRAEAAIFKRNADHSRLLFLRSLNPTGAPTYGLIDCVAVNAFRQSTEERVYNAVVATLSLLNSFKRFMNSKRDRIKDLFFRAAPTE